MRHGPSPPVVSVCWQPPLSSRCAGSHPFFVSDATRGDVDHTLAVLAAAPDPNQAAVARVSPPTSERERQPQRIEIYQRIESLEATLQAPGLSLVKVLAPILA
jgi:hypothetical protein